MTCSPSISGPIDRVGVNNGRRRSGKQNFIACLKTRIRTRFNVLPAAQNPLDHNPPANLFLDLAYGPARRRRHLVCARLEFPVQKIFGLGFGAAR